MSDAGHHIGKGPFYVHHVHHLYLNVMDCTVQNLTMSCLPQVGLEHLEGFERLVSFCHSARLTLQGIDIPKIDCILRQTWKYCG